MSADVQSSPKVGGGLADTRHHHQQPHQQQQQQQQHRRQQPARRSSGRDLPKDANNSNNKKNNNNHHHHRSINELHKGGVGGGPGGGRKRSQSFSAGGGKLFPSYKRRKKDTHIIPPTKFLLGGNICDPLNLNSLLDEDINRAMNAVTPKSSPLPTPKHRKGEVEVIIPPNINDPLNLLMTVDCDDPSGEAANYEKMLLLVSSSSPLKRNSKRNKRKRRHTKSGSQKDDSGNDETGLGVDEARPSEADTAAASEATAASAGEAAQMEVASLTRTKANLKLDLSCVSATRPDSECTSAGVQDTAKRRSGGDAAGGVVVDGVTSEAISGGDGVMTSESGSSAEQSVVVTPTTTTPTTSGAVPVSKKCRKESKDKIVSPAIPQPGAWGDKSHHHHHHHRFRAPPPAGHRLTPQIDKNQKTPNFKEVNTRFRYGNYNRYYGYRNACRETDPRLRALARRRDLFEGRDVLDIGCNVGHVTLAIARDLRPRRIVGVDIDRTLIDAAKRNVKHYVKGGGVVGSGSGGGASTGGGSSASSGSASASSHHQQQPSTASDKNRFPSAMSVMYGPLNAPAASHRLFPYNVSFVQGNYVLDSDMLVGVEQTQQFDTIVCLSVTKWFHLNWGDTGLKRAFRRMYAQLRPGGQLILEPQPWHSYKKKRNLTPEIWKNYTNIELFPHKFSQFLLSEVGFTKCEVLCTPHHHAKGFQRPIKLFTKGDVSSAPCSVRTEEPVQTGSQPSAPVEEPVSTDSRPSACTEELHRESMFTEEITQESMCTEELVQTGSEQSASTGEPVQTDSQPSLCTNEVAHQSEPSTEEPVQTGPQQSAPTEELVQNVSQLSASTEELVQTCSQQSALTEEPVQTVSQLSASTEEPVQTGFEKSVSTELKQSAGALQVAGQNGSDKSKCEVGESVTTADISSSSQQNADCDQR